MTHVNRTRGHARGLARRQFLAAGLSAGALLAALPLAARFAAAQHSIETSARVVIIGAGAGGLAAAARLRRRLEGAQITLIDGKRDHWYQPGLTLVGAGLWPADRLIRPNARYVPDGVDWIRHPAREIDPVAQTVTTAAGDRVAYDFLVVAPGLSLDYAGIEGMEPGLIGREGIGSIYAGPLEAAATWQAMARFIESGGDGWFGRPDTDIKCAGAPLKVAMIVDDLMRRHGTRSSAQLAYAAHSAALFGVPIVNDRVEALFAERSIETAPNHVLRAIDPGARRAVYETPEGPVERDYDFIHVVPPMHAPDVVGQSELAWRDGPFAAGGWLEVDPDSLIHPRFGNVVGIGDVNGVPKGKTAASVKWQTPVAVDNLIATLEEREPEAAYNGYTSCPLITGIGRAMLVEFDYANNLTPSFAGIDPLTEHWIVWAMEEHALPAVYYAMLQGEA
jgi:sulfide:quinone oxidoreductase